MKAVLLASVFTCLSAPAFAQTTCPGGQEYASEEFVMAFQEASGALSAKDFGRVLALTAVARPEATSPMQKISVTQLEIAAVAGMNDRETAARLIKGALPDPCLPEPVRLNYRAMLTKWGMPTD